MIKKRIRSEHEIKTNNQRVRDRRQHRIALGLCMNCGLPSRPRKQKCAKCQSEQNHRINTRRRNTGDSVLAWLHTLLSTSQRQHRRAKGLSWPNNLDLEWLVHLYNTQQGRCAVTGISMTTKARDILAISIDRVDSQIGYLKDNVILVCRWVNLGRGKYCSVERFREIINNLPQLETLPDPSDGDLAMIGLPDTEIRRIIGVEDIETTTPDPRDG